MDYVTLVGSSEIEKAIRNIACGIGEAVEIITESVKTLAEELQKLFEEIEKEIRNLPEKEKYKFVRMYSKCGINDEYLLHQTYHHKPRSDCRKEL